jgi:hypothetical protein
MRNGPPDGPTITRPSFSTARLDQTIASQIKPDQTRPQKITETSENGPNGVKNGPCVFHDMSV